MSPPQLAGPGCLRPWPSGSDQASPSVSSPRALVSPSRSSTVTVSAEWPRRLSRDGTFSAKWDADTSLVVGAKAEAVVSHRAPDAERRPPAVVAGDVGPRDVVPGGAHPEEAEGGLERVVSQRHAVPVPLEPEGEQQGQVPAVDGVTEVLSHTLGSSS